MCTRKEANADAAGNAGPTVVPPTTGATAATTGSSLSNCQPGPSAASISLALRQLESSAASAAETIIPAAGSFSVESCLCGYVEAGSAKNDAGNAHLYGAYFQEDPLLQRRKTTKVGGLFKSIPLALQALKVSLL